MKESCIASFYRFLTYDSRELDIMKYPECA